MIESKLLIIKQAVSRCYLSSINNILLFLLFFVLEVLEYSFVKSNNLTSYRLMDSWDFISCDQIQCFNNVKRKSITISKYFNVCSQTKIVNVKC